MNTEVVFVQVDFDFKRIFGPDVFTLFEFKIVYITNIFFIVYKQAQSLVFTKVCLTALNVKPSCCDKFRFWHKVISQLLKTNLITYLKVFLVGLSLSNHSNLQLYLSNTSFTSLNLLTLFFSLLFQSLNCFQKNVTVEFLLLYVAF